MPRQTETSPFALRLVVADAETERARALAEVFAQGNGVAVVGVAADVEALSRLVEAARPDAVIVDAQSFGSDAFTIAEWPTRPLVVVTTDSSSDAVRAFEHGMLDCLVRPYRPERVSVTVARVREELDRRRAMELHRRLASILAEQTPAGDLPQPARLPPRHLTARAGDRFVLIEPSEIVWLESAANYVRIHTRRGSYLRRGTISEMELLLEEGKFTRIHRSHIVNVAEVREVAPNPRGDFDVLLKTGHRLKMSRNFRDRLLAG